MTNQIKKCLYCGRCYFVIDDEKKCPFCGQTDDNLEIFKNMFGDNNPFSKLTGE